MQVMFEIGVIGFNDRKVEAARDPQAAVMCSERCVNMNEVKIAELKAIAPIYEMSPLQQTIFRIKRDRARGNAHEILMIWCFWGMWIEWGH